MRTGTKIWTGVFAVSGVILSGIVLSIYRAVSNPTVGLAQVDGVWLLAIVPGIMGIGLFTGWLAIRNAPKIDSSLSASLTEAN